MIGISFTVSPLAEKSMDTSVDCAKEVEANNPKVIESKSVLNKFIANEIG